MIAVIYCLGREITRNNAQEFLESWCGEKQLEYQPGWCDYEELATRTGIIQFDLFGNTSGFRICEGGMTEETFEELLSFLKENDNDGNAVALLNYFTTIQQLRTAFVCEGFDFQSILGEALKYLEFKSVDELRKHIFTECAVQKVPADKAAFQKQLKLLYHTYLTNKVNS